jgi:hypothetical protein
VTNVATAVNGMTAVTDFQYGMKERDEVAVVKLHAKMCQAAEGNRSTPLEVNRKRFPPVGSRSVDLVAGLSSPLLCAPAWRPAHLLGCSTLPRPAACLAAASASCCLGAPLGSQAPTQVLVVRPICCTSGAGVPTQGTSYWGHPPRVERTSWPELQLLVASGR